MRNICLHAIGNLENDPRPARIYNYLKGQNHQITVVQYSYQKTSKILRAISLIFFLIFINKEKSLRAFLGLQSSNNEINIESNEFDLHIVEDPLILPLLPKKLLNKTICDLREFHPHSRNGLKFFLTYQRVYVFIYNNLLSKCKKIITVSNYHCELIKKSFHDNCETLLSWPSNTSFSTFIPTTYPIKIVYLGLANKYRGLNFLCDSISTQKDLKLDLYLSGEELYLNKLQKKYRKYENINFYPMIPSNMVGEYLRNYHIGIIIYWKNRNAKNAMPNKFFQYITSGLMLMSLKNTEMGNFIDEHKIGITLEKPKKKILRNTLKHIDLETINFFRKSSIETAKLQSASTNSDEIIRKFLL